MTNGNPGCRLCLRFTVGAIGLLAVLAAAGCGGGHGHPSSGAASPVQSTGKVTITSATSPTAGMAACDKVLPASVLAQAIGAPKGSYSLGPDHTQVQDRTLQCEYDQSANYGESQLYVEISPSPAANVTPNANEIVGTSGNVTAQLQLAPAPGVNPSSVRAALETAAGQVQFK